MTQRQFKDWLDRLVGIWENKEPQKATDLCAEKFLWYETPFSEPLKTNRQLLKEWKGVLSQENISVSYEILSISGNVGIAQWRADFTKLPSKEKVTLDGIFKVSLNEQGECTEFRQWFNLKE